MKLGAGLEWLVEYIKMAEKVVPNVRMLQGINSKVPTEDKMQLAHGEITKWSEPRKMTYYTMYMYTHYQWIYNHKGWRASIHKYSKMDMLTHLAHEISHIQHWEHTTEHKLLEVKLLKMFVQRLRRNGYVSEEAENEQTKKRRCRKIG